MTSEEIVQAFANILECATAYTEREPGERHEVAKLKGDLSAIAEVARGALENLGG